MTSVGFHIYPVVPIPFPIGFSQMHWYKSCRALHGAFPFSKAGTQQDFGMFFLEELEEMREAGQIREDIDQTDAGVTSVWEFFELIDGKPDEEKVRIFCALFMNANAPNADDSAVAVDLDLMRILRDLSAGEMRLLSTCLRTRTFKVPANGDIHVSVA